MRFQEIGEKNRRECAGQRRPSEDSRLPLIGDSYEPASAAQKAATSPSKS
jgi:hypothetical protein